MPETITLEHTDIELVNTHDPARCAGQSCTIHHRSRHHMRRFPQNWRSDAGFMERICLHGIGHPDPDELERNRSGVHGCDGCCVSRSLWRRIVERVRGGAR